MNEIVVFCFFIVYNIRYL
ncbi:unnamed protein product [Rotaria magnacalcarata]|uniref:Uncharacterized protein n=1 Tax=Rotaria magnacalcarata TaxID=392030 RepID=A0A815WKV1_9BILA|nr:unnamed protein product [Rotaria magnacalcarata]CAF1576738.1 unnamed protein product [Rotaria magnacalcarata]